MWTWDPGVEIGRFRGGHGIQGVETGSRGWKRAGLGICKVGGVGSRVGGPL